MTHSLSDRFRLPGLALVALAVLGLVGLVACGPGAEEGTDESAAVDVPEYTIEQFMDNTSLRSVSFTQDGSRIAVTSDASGIPNVWVYPVDGSEPIQLTDSEEPVTSLGWFPDDQRILVFSDQGGNEKDHLYVREADGTLTDLTPGDNVKARFYGWAEDDTGFFAGISQRDERFFDLYEIDADTYEKTLLHQEDRGLQFAHISSDRRYVAFTEVLSELDTNILILDRETGEIENITPHEGQVQNFPMKFTRDGGSLLYTTDEGSEFMYLVRQNLETGVVEELVKPEWGVLGAGTSEDDTYLLVYINADSKTEVRVYEMATMEPVELPELPEADITGLTISPDERRLGFYASDSRTPSDLFVADIGGDEVQRLSRTLNPEIDPEHLVQPEVVRFASYDGLEIPGVLYRPLEASADNPVPALVWIHGGPGGQSRVGWNSLIQYLVNHGYAVYAINNRGSGGYGKTFSEMDNLKHGEADLGDVIASKDWLASMDWIDGDQIAVIGGSYGGYLTLAAMTYHPEVFTAGVDIFGVSNWLRTLESIPPWWESIREALYLEMGDPAEDRERLERISPLFHAENIQRPLMVLQGANDPRVLQVESDEIVEAVRANGVPVEYLVFEDEGHGFRKKENQLEAYREIREFLDRYVKGEAPADEAATDEAQREAA